MGVPIRLVLALDVVVEVGGPPVTGGALQTTPDYKSGPWKGPCKVKIAYYLSFYLVELMVLSRRLEHLSASSRASIQHLPAALLGARNIKWEVGRG